MESADPDIERLVSWAVAAGASCQSITVVGRTLRTNEAVPAGHALVQLPLKHLITVEAACADVIYGEAFKALVEANLPEKALLALYVALERAKGEHSDWAAYLNSLPKRYATPLWFDDKELEALKGTRVAAGLWHETRELKQLIGRWGHALGKQVMKTCTGAGAKAVAKTALQPRNLRWAHSAVVSRAFTLLLGGQPKIAMVPVFDLGDHDPTARVTWLTEEQEGRVSFITDAPLPAGATVYNNYGQKPNEELLQGYGFALLNNPADRFHIRLGIRKSPKKPQDPPAEDPPSQDPPANTPASLGPSYTLIDSPEVDPLADVHLMDSPNTTGDLRMTNGSDKPKAADEQEPPTANGPLAEPVANGSAAEEPAREEEESANGQQEEKLIASDRLSLLKSLGVSLEHELSLKEPLPSDLLAAARLCFWPERLVYHLCTGVLQNILTETQPLDTGKSALDLETVRDCHLASEFKAVAALRHSLQASLHSFAGSADVAADQQLLADWEAREDNEGVPDGISSQAEAYCVVLRLGQKEIVWAALEALERRAAELVARLQPPPRCLPDTPAPRTPGRSSALPPGNDPASSSQYISWLLENGSSLLGVEEVRKRFDVHRGGPSGGACGSGEPRGLEEGGQWQVRVSKDCSAGELLAEIPVDLICTPQLGAAQEPGMANLAQLGEASALKLLLLLAQSSSDWPLLSRLTAFPTPALCWGGQILEALAGTPVWDQVCGAREALVPEFQEVAGVLKELRPEAEPSYDDFLWVHSVVERVAHLLPPVPNPEGERNRPGAPLAIAPILYAIPNALIGSVIDLAWSEDGLKLELRAVCPLTVGTLLVEPLGGEDNEIVLLQEGGREAILDNSEDTFEVNIGPVAGDPLREVKGHLLAACGLGEAHFLKLPPKPHRILSTIAVCALKTEEEIAACRGPELEIAVKEVEAVLSRPWHIVKGKSIGNAATTSEAPAQEAEAQPEASTSTSVFYSATKARWEFLQHVRTNERLKVAVSALSDMLIDARQELEGGSAEEDLDLWAAMKGQDLRDANLEAMLGALAYRHGQKKILDGWIGAFESLHRTLGKKRRKEESKENKKQKTLQ